MHQAVSFLGALKKCLKAKGLTYGDLASKMELSEASVKRIFAEGTLSLDRIAIVLDALNMSFFEVAKLTNTDHQENQDCLSFDQESVLAEDPKLFAFFHLLLFGKSLQDLLKLYELSRQQTEGYLATLSDLGLIEKTLNECPKVLVTRNIKWQENGPLRSRYGIQIRDEFLSGSFEGKQSIITFTTRSLSVGSQALVRRKIELLLNEIAELSTVDSTALKSKSEATSLMIAFRPFSFSVVNAFKKRRSS